MTNKTIISIYSTPQKFHEEALKYFQPKPLQGHDAEAFYAQCWTFAVYNFLKHDTLAGYLGRTTAKLFQELALDWIYLRRKDFIWLEIKRKFTGLFNMLQWTTESTDKSNDNKKLTSFGKQSEEAKALPLLNMMGDGRGTVDWAELSKTVLKGFYQDGKFSPNVENDNSDGWKHHKETHKEQRNQQIARIITAMLDLQTHFTAYLEKYRHKYTWRWSVMPGQLNIDYSTGKFNYISPPVDPEVEIDDAGQPVPKRRADLDDISEVVWAQKLAKGEAVEKTWYLEYLARKKKRILSTIKGKNSAGQEQGYQIIAGIDKAMKAFSHNSYIPSLDYFDKVMNSIEGFKIFKSELRLRSELMQDDQAKGIETVLKPMCLLGKPGVGKTEIVKTLAKALRRPLVIISMGGAIDTKDIEGTPPTYQSPNWSRLLEAMTFTNTDITITLAELQEQLAEYESIKNKTEFQQSELKEIKELIKDMEKNDETERKIDANSKAPIILFDEAEKVTLASVLDALGKVLDPNVNTRHWDKFFEGYLNLKYCIIFLTMNWETRCPQFIKDRCDMIDIELLTYQQRINILQTFGKRLLRQAWPIMQTNKNKPDYAKNKELEDNNTLTPKQQELYDKLGTKILSACVTETWGVRQAIINLERVIDLMRITDKEGKLALINNLDNWDWDSDQDGSEEEISDKTRIIKYRALTDANNHPRPLQLSKVIHQDFIPKQTNTHGLRVQTVQNTIPSWPNYQPQTNEFSPAEGSTLFDAQRQEIEKLKGDLATEKDQPRVNTLIVNNIPINGKLRFGVNTWEQSLQIISFDEEEGKKLKNLRINNCKNLIQLDLTNLINLEKLSLRNSHWDSIKGADQIQSEYKLVVKNCQNVSLAWTEGTNVGVVEIDL
jgi:hypothetical protein